MTTKTARTVYIAEHAAALLKRRANQSESGAVNFLRGMFDAMNRDDREFFDDPDDFISAVAVAADYLERRAR